MPNNQQIQSLTVDGVTYDIVDNTSGYIAGMTILSYGSSTWNDFITAYNNKSVVYCRASSNSNPATGSQTRLAFMAYVNNAETPTEVEFQYYRSVSSHSEAQQGDQVYVYKLTSAGTWTVTTREAYTEIDVGGDLTKSYANGTLTLSATIPSISGLAPINSPEFTGTPTAPTPTSGDDSTKIATTAFVQDAMSAAGAGTVTNVEVANATNGGLTVSGSPITSSGTITIGHSNVLSSAYTDAGLYPIKIDKNGHINYVGNSVSSTQNASTGISIADHSTSSIYGVQSSTTSVTGVQSSTTTASKVTLGTDLSIPNVTGNSDVTVPIRADSDVTVPIAASSATTVPIKNTSATTIPTAASSATSCDDITAWSAGSGSLTFTMDTTDTKKLVISHTHTAPSLSYTSRSITGVDGSTSIYGVQSSTTSVTGVSGSTSVRGVKTGTSSTTTASKVTLGTAISVPNVTGATDVTVPIKNTSATTVPIKNTSSTSVVTGATHSITDNGHQHSI